MARLPRIKAESTDDQEILGIFAWVTEMEEKVPNRFAINLNFPELTKSKLGFTKVLWETEELSPEEIQHVSIIVSKANRCDCTGAFCTILVHSLGGERVYEEQLLESGSAQISDRRLLAITAFAEKVH